VALRSQLPKRERQKVMDQFLEMDVGTLLATVKTSNDKHMALTMAIGSLLSDFNMVRWPHRDAWSGTLTCPLARVAGVVHTA